MSNHKNKSKTTSKSKVNRYVENDSEWTNLALKNVANCKEKIPVGFVAFLFTQMLDFLAKDKKAKKLVERVGSDNMYMIFTVLINSFLPTLYINTAEGKKEYTHLLESKESSGKA